MRRVGHVRRFGIIARCNGQRALKRAGISLLAIIIGLNAAEARRSIVRMPTVTPEQSSSPLLLLVSIKKQRVVIYDANGEVTTSRVSTGRPGFDTPTGIFSLLEKDIDHRSNIYDGADMPFMQRITWSGVALHAGVVPGYRASHGCIRLPYSFAKTLFGLTKVGNRVVVTGEEAEPIAFDSPKLFKPLPLDDASASKSGMREQKLAINDRGTDPAASDALSELPRLIGVSPAMAKAFADAPRDAQQRPATRTEADRLFTERMSRLRTDITTTENARIAATERAKATLKEFDAANGRMADAQKSLERTRDAVKASEKKQQDAARSFETFMSGIASGTAPTGGDAQDREADISDALLNASADADQARADVVRNELKVAEVKPAFNAASAARDAALEAVKQAQINLRAAQTALIEGNKETLRRNKPVSVFVSLRTGHISVRQGVDPVLEASIAVNLSGRVGTHVFTAMRYAHDPNAFEWKLVSAHTPSPGEAFDDGKPKRRRHKDSASPQSTTLNIRMANAALDSFTIPDEIQAKIAELAKPGSSLIVSDRDLPANENGAGTEFVVLTH